MWISVKERRKNVTREGTSAIIANRFNASVKWSILGAFWGAFQASEEKVCSHFSIVDYMFSMRISLVLAWILLVLYYSSIMIIIIRLVFSSASVVVIIIKRVVG